MKRLLFILTLLTTIPIWAQQAITLEECYNLVTANYPLAKQAPILDAQNQIDAMVISKAKLPQLQLDVQATYQSDVIEIPIPNSNIQPLNKDQYRATLTLNQMIYNGGATDASLQLNSAALKTKQKEVEITLYQLKKQVNQLYFSILLAEESIQLLTAKQAQLEAKLGEVQAGVKYGLLLPASDKILAAELLKIAQQTVEVDNNKMALIETLSSLTGQALGATTTFQTPLVDTRPGSVINRPELELFQYKKDEIESAQMLIAKQDIPKLLGFVTSGYGNPGLNMLDNSFQPFYTVGVKLNWNVFDWNTHKKQRESLVINKDILDNETEIFKLNTNIELDRQQQEIKKIEAFLTTDIEIIKLRKEVLDATDAQLKNGVITPSTYLTELTNLYVDQNTLATHKIQLQLAKANYNITQGL